MVLSKLFKSKNKTTNVGNMHANQGKLQEDLGINHFLIFTDLEGAPTYLLRETLTVGREVGEVIIDDDIISPRHCTFTKNQDVISLMDHSSQSGTTIGKNKLSPGRNYIINESDKIRLGDLNVKIQTQAIDYEEGVTAEQPTSMADVAMKVPPVREEPEIDHTAELKLETSAVEDVTQTEIKNIDATVSNITAGTVADIEVPKTKKELKLEAKAAKQKAKAEAKQAKLEAKLAAKEAKMQAKLDAKAAKKQGKVKATDRKKTEKKRAKNAVLEASSTIPRLIALVIDGLFAFMIFEILSPYEDFHNSLKYIPELVHKIIIKFTSFNIVENFQVLIVKYPSLGSIVEEITVYETEIKEIFYLYVLFGVLRVFGAFTFGVSLGQFVIGMTGQGNLLWQRVGGALREMIGVVTYPFLVFDLSTLFSVRSLKELVTFTKVTTQSTLRTTLLTIIFLPLFVAAVLIAPLFQGVEIHATYDIKMEEKGLMASKNYKYESDKMNLSMELHNKFITLPNFKFIKNKSKNFVKRELKFISSAGEVVLFSHEKTFDFAKLIKIALSKDLFPKKNFPHLYGYIFNVGNSNKNFNATLKDDEKLAIAKDVKSLLKICFALGFDEIIDHVKIHGPFLKGFIDFRDRIDELIDGTPTNLNIFPVGNNFFITAQIAESNNLRTIMIPIFHEGHVYSVTTNKKIKFDALSEHYLSHINWFNVDKKKIKLRHSPNLNVLEVIDYFMDMNLSEKNRMDLNQTLYGHLYEVGKVALDSGNKNLRIEVQRSIGNIIDLIKVLDKQKKKPDPKLIKQNANIEIMDPFDKLNQNINELLRALKKNNFEYFGITGKRSAVI